MQFNCNPEYMMQGQPIIACQDNGRWSGPIPKCKFLKQKVQLFKKLKSSDFLFNMKIIIDRCASLFLSWNCNKWPHVFS